ncbi:MAG TPA: S8 family serine peptidase [Solirubrobacteraceae bacterium]|nr:S8 family serine peptidase [Solirubrobacteraceae bacterium]
MTARRLALALALAVTALVPATASAGDELRGEQWNLDAINADAAHAVNTGSGALVAVIDSGVQSSHPDLAGNVIDGHDFIQGDATPNDENGHGTNVAGIIAAKRNNGIGIAGAAPDAKVLAIRVLDAANRGNTSQEAAGIDAAVAAGAQVINLSLSAGPNVVTQLLPDDELVQAIERAARAGVVVVAAAGNDGVPLCAQPVLATKILCVGAVNRARARTAYSNYAVRVDMVAPGGETRAGEGILSAQLGGGYSGMAGTSQATPHVAAAAALLVSLGLRGDAVIDRLLNTATNLGDPAQLGRGLLNMSAAVAGLAPATEPSSDPGAGATFSASVPKQVRLSKVRQRGLSVRCTSPSAGTCRVRVTRAGREIARGSRRVPAGVATAVTARLTAAGKRSLARARGRRFTAKVAVTGPAAGAVSLKTTLTR